jgi:hypothetical protein
MSNATQTPSKIHWRDVDVWYDEGDTVRGEEQRAALLEYRNTGAIRHYWLADPEMYDGDLEPIDGDGPNLDMAGPKVEEIDWTGIDAQV